MEPVYKYSWQYNGGRDNKEQDDIKGATYLERWRSCDFACHSMTNPNASWSEEPGATKRTPVPRTWCYIKQDDLFENVASKIDDIVANSSDQELREIISSKAFVSTCPKCAVKVKINGAAVRHGDNYINKFIDEFEKEEIRREHNAMKARKEKLNTIISSIVIGLFGMIISIASQNG